MWVTTDIAGCDDLQLSLYRSQLRDGHFLRIRATGASMWPSVRAGDIVHIERLDTLSSGDILVYRRGRQWIVHRLVRIEQNGRGEHQLILRGDALVAEDAAIDVGQALGRVCLIERGSRRIRMDSMQNRLYRCLFRTPLLARSRLPLFYIRLRRWVRLPRRR